VLELVQRFCTLRNIRVDIQQSVLSHRGGVAMDGCYSWHVGDSRRRAEKGFYGASHPSVDVAKNRVCSAVSSNHSFIPLHLDNRKSAPVLLCADCASANAFIPLQHDSWTYEQAVGGFPLRFPPLEEDVGIPR